MSSPPLTTRFERFLDALMPSKAQRDLAKKELDFLEEELANAIQEDDPFEFVKALRSGSYAKATMLKRQAAGDFDADLSVYVRAEAGEAAPIDDLLNYTESLVRRAYEKTDRTPEFDRSSRSSVKIKFTTTPKINIDVVPVVGIENDAIPNWGAIPRRDGEKRLTSVSEHIEFVTSRNKKLTGVPFHQLIRIWKWWRNHAFSEEEQDKVSSFFLELVVGHAFDQMLPDLKGVALDDLSRLSLAVMRHGLREPIDFPDARVPAATSAPTGPVVVLDPVNRDNNVCHDWTEADRTRFIEEVQRFRDVLRDAQVDDSAGEPDSAAAFLDQVLPNFSNWTEDE